MKGELNISHLAGFVFCRSSSFCLIKVFSHSNSLKQDQTSDWFDVTVVGSFKAFCCVFCVSPAESVVAVSGFPAWND